MITKWLMTFQLWRRFLVQNRAPAEPSDCFLLRGRFRLLPPQGGHAQQQMPGSGIPVFSGNHLMRVLWPSCPLRRWRPKEFSGLIEPKSDLNGFHELLPVLLLGEFNGLLGSFHGLGEPAGLGVGGGQRVENCRFPPAGKLCRPLGQLDCLGAVANRRVGIGRQGSRPYR